VEKGICKIKYNNGELDNGLLCSIQCTDSQLIKFVMINSHNWEKSDNFGKIKLTIKDELKDIIIDESRIKYINEEYGITVIEITDIDNINKDLFFELDDTNIKDIFSIYILYYSEENKKIIKIDGKIKKIYENNNIFEYISDNNPDLKLNPIINKNNNKIIGINKFSKNNNDFNKNKGISIKKIIEEFTLKIKQNNIIKEKDIDLNNGDLITIEYEYDGQEKITLFGERFVENNIDKCTMIINEEEYNIRKKMKTKVFEIYNNKLKIQLKIIKI
jgi:hypothetical protein